MASAPTALLLIFLFASAVSPSNADFQFIFNTCQKTRNPSLCVNLLTKDGNDRNATTVADLAGIFVLLECRVATLNWADIGDLIDSRRGSTPPKSPQFIAALNNCLSHYARARDKLTKATGEMDFARYNVAWGLIYHASSAAWKCEEGFTMAQSPLTQKNKDFLSGCAVSEDLISLLIN